jgi:hypothetical protein
MEKLKKYNKLVEEIYKNNPKANLDEIYQKVAELYKSGKIQDYFMQCELCGEDTLELNEYEGKLICNLCLKIEEYKKIQKKIQTETGRRVIE